MTLPANSALGAASPAQSEFSNLMPGMLGGLGGMLGASPFSKAQPYMQGAGSAISAATAAAQKGLDPYAQAGQAGLKAYQAMLAREANPGQFYNQLMSGFQMSPAQQQAQQQGLRAVSSNAALHGMMGSGDEAKSLEEYAQNNTSQAQQQYLQNLMSMYNQALGGYGTLTGRGQQAATQQGQFGMQGAQEQAELQEALAQMAAAQQASQNQGVGNVIGGIAGAIGSLF